MEALLPELQVYVVAPLAISVAIPPLQILEELTCSVGLGVMLRFTAALEVPQALDTTKL